MSDKIIAIPKENFDEVVKTLTKMKVMVLNQHVQDKFPEIKCFKARPITLEDVDYVIDHLTNLLLDKGDFVYEKAEK